MVRVLIRVPGRAWPSDKASLKVPVVFNDETETQSAVISRSFEWVVSFETLAVSNVKFKSGIQFIELYGWTFATHRYVSGNMTGSLYTSGSVQSENLVLIVPHGSHGPKIEAWMYHGKIFKEVYVARFGWTEGKCVPIQVHKFTFVRIVEFRVNMKYYVIQLQVRSKETDVTIFNQETGAEKGHKKSTTVYGEAKMTIAASIKDDEVNQK